MKHYKLILLVCVTLFTSNSLFAGDDEGGKKGVRAGWQVSSMSLDGSTDSTNTMNSFYVGLFGEKKINPSFEIRLWSRIQFNRL